MDFQSNKGSRTQCALLRPTTGQAARVAPAASETGNRLTAADRETIARYFEGRWPRPKVARLHGRSRPRKRWMIGGKLPAGVRSAGLPRELEQELTPLDAGYVRLMVGAEILCVEEATSKIMDVMRNGGQPAVQLTPQLLLDGPVDQSLAV